MRQLFLPACVCLATFAGATAIGPKLPMQELAGAFSTDRKGDTRTAALQTTGVAVDEPVQHKSAAGEIALTVPELTDEQFAGLLSGLAIEFPVPSGKADPIPLPPIPKPVVTRSQEEICGALIAAAQGNDLPLPFFIHLLFQESRFNPAVVSPAGAEGVAQFTPETAAYIGLVNPYDPLQAIYASARLLRKLTQQFGNLGLAAAAYNAGPRRIQDWLDKRGNLPEETVGYVKTVTGHPVENWSMADARHPLQRLPRRAPCQETAGLLAWNGPDAVPVPAPSPHRVASSVAKHTATAASRTDLKVTHSGGRVSATVEIAETGNGGKAAKAGEQTAKDRDGKHIAATEQAPARKTKTKSKEVAER